MPKRRGQPALDPDDLVRDSAGKTPPIGVRAPASEQAIWLSAAQDRGETKSEFVRAACNERALGRAAAMERKDARIAELERQLDDAVREAEHLLRVLAQIRDVADAEIDVE